MTSTARSGASPEETPRRLTQGQILAMMLSRGSGERSAVSLSRNARGATQIEVTVRTGEGDGPQTVEEAATKAQAVYDQLRTAYPLESTDA